MLCITSSFRLGFETAVGWTDGRCRAEQTKRSGLRGYFKRVERAAGGGVLGNNAPAFLCRKEFREFFFKENTSVT